MAGVSSPSGLPVIENCKSEDEWDEGLIPPDKTVTPT